MPESKHKIADAQRDRIAGAILGAFIGDALGVGCQWYYEPGALERDFGPWIETYVDPKPGGSNIWGKVMQHRYNKGVCAGDGSQTSAYMDMLLTSVAANKGYNRDDFAAQLDSFFCTLDGPPEDPYAGLWTEECVRVLRKARAAGTRWADPEFRNPSDCADVAMRGVVLAATYRNPTELARIAFSDAQLYGQDRWLVGHILTYVLFVQGLINGQSIDTMSTYMQRLGDDKGVMQYVQNYDTIDSTKKGEVAHDPAIRAIPAKSFVKTYGLDCTMLNLLPGAYFLAHRHAGDFEQAVLSAINSGGNNMARATLTGGIMGAMVGLSGIPDRLITGLKRAPDYLQKANDIAEFSVGDPNYTFADYNPSDDAMPHSADEAGDA